MDYLLYLYPYSYWKSLTIILLHYWFKKLEDYYKYLHKHIFKELKKLSWIINYVIAKFKVVLLIYFLKTKSRNRILDFILYEKSEMQ